MTFVKVAKDLIISWPKYSQDERALVNDRLEKFKVLILQDRFKVHDSDLFEIKLKEKAINYNNSMDPLTWIFDLLRAAGSQDLDLEQFEYSYKKVLKYNLDTIFYPADFNYSFIGDIFKFESLVNISKNINNLKNELLKHSYQLTPSIYFQDNQKKFKTKVSEIVIKNYSSKKVSLIKKKYKKLLDGENQIKANTKSNSSYYNFTKKFIKKCDFLADIACGQGDGFVNLSSISKKSIGYDKNKKYIYAAEQKYKKIKNIEFRKIKAPFILEKEKFDVVTSFHTLEHLEKKEHQNFIRNIFNSLKKKGKFFLEVPLLLKRPLGEPLLPVHLHEPSFNELSSRLIKNGFNIKKAMVKDRHRYYDVKIDKNGNILSHQTKLKVCGYFYCTKK